MQRYKLLYRLDRLAATLAGFALLLMMLAGAADVISGNLLNNPIAGTHEIIETLMVASAFLAMAYAQAQGGHIRVDLITSRLPVTARVVCGLSSHLLTALLFIGIAWFGWDSVIQSIHSGEFSAGSLPVPIWPARAALAVGATLMVVQSLEDLRRDLMIAVFGESAGEEPR